MKHTMTAPGEFTTLFGETEGPQANEPKMHFPEHAKETPSDFTRCFRDRKISPQPEAPHENLPPDFLLKDAPMIPEADAVELATQIIHQQRDEPAQLPSALPVKAAPVPPQVSISAPVLPVQPNQPSAGVSIGTVIALLFGFMVCLHLEAILILLVARH